LICFIQCEFFFTKEPSKTKQETEWKLKTFPY
jgi:hypothetical protein